MGRGCPGLQLEEARSVSSHAPQIQSGMGVVTKATHMGGEKGLA